MRQNSCYYPLGDIYPPRIVGVGRTSSVCSSAENYASVNYASVNYASVNYASISSQSCSSNVYDSSLTYNSLQSSSRWGGLPIVSSMVVQDKVFPVYRLCPEDEYQVAELQKEYQEVD